tara:strand:- start:236 stop:436 length:201 start_codon:yes stop_codon:yes gene_type:complete
MAVGYLGWKPRDFWESTPWEFTVSLKGYFDAQAAKNGTKHRKRMTKNDLFDLRDKCEKLRDKNGDN